MFRRSEGRPGDLETDAAGGVHAGIEVSADVQFSGERVAVELADEREGETEAADRRIVDVAVGANGVLPGRSEGGIDVGDINGAEDAEVAAVNRGGDMGSPFLRD